MKGYFYETIFFIITGILMVFVTYYSNNTFAMTELKADSPPRQMTMSVSDRRVDDNISSQSQDDTNTKLDIFGIRKIYETKPGGFEWYMNMDDPDEDRYLYNDGDLDKNSDNTYNIDGESRLSVYSQDGIGNDEGNMDTYDFSKLREKGYWHKPTDWKNVEITGEYYHREGDGPGITHYVRSEDHSGLHNGCGGSSYKNKIYFDGTSNFNKEQAHPTSWEMPHIEHNYGDLKNHWFRFKSVVLNLPNGDVNLENWLDPYNNNSWIRIGQLTDNGGWGEDGTKCGGKPDEIITWGGPSVTFRWDEVTIDFRNLSIREIDPFT